MTTTAKTTAIAYCRVSTDMQADHGVSLEAQEAKVRAFAALYDIELTDVVIDAGASAKSLDRPGLQRALEALRKGKATALLVPKLDRLTRSVRDLGELVDRYFASGKCALLSVEEKLDTASASGRMVLNLLTTVAQWERETIGERTRSAMQHRRAQGKFNGGRSARYGYRLADDGASLVEIPEEQAMLRAARELRSSGHSLRAIASALDQRAMRTRTGRRFSAVEIRRIVAQ